MRSEGDEAPTRLHAQTRWTQRGLAAQLAQRLRARTGMCGRHPPRPSRLTGNEERAPAAGRASASDAYVFTTRLSNRTSTDVFDSS
jgi:hypothetical protein